MTYREIDGKFVYESTNLIDRFCLNNFNGIVCENLIENHETPENGISLKFGFIKNNSEKVFYKVYTFSEEELKHITIFSSRGLWCSLGSELLDKDFLTKQKYFSEDIITPVLSISSISCETGENVFLY